MTKYRTIETSFKGPEKHWVGDGFYVSQYFPEGQDLLERFSPFILMDYNAPHYFAPEGDKRLGVGAHPHRGFETVTIDYAGTVEHHDNKGNKGKLNPGDVQWMTAGSGVLHKEYHGSEFADKGGMFHMVQLWVNLPQKDKMTDPHYQPITKDQMGIVPLKDNHGEVRIISGEFDGTKGPAATYSPINLYNVHLKNHGEVELHEPSHFNTGMLVINGEVKVNEDRTFKEGDFVLFDNVEGEIKVEAISDDALFLVLSGEPLNEPVVAYGPFVMNTRDEILQAYQDFRDGKFGTEDF